MLIAPAGKLMNSYAGRSAPSLAAFNSKKGGMICIVHGTHDTIVPFEDSVELFHSLTNDKKDIYEEPTNHHNLHTNSRMIDDLRSSYPRLIVAEGHDHMLHGFITDNFMHNELSRIIIWETCTTTNTSYIYVCIYVLAFVREAFYNECLW